MRLAEAVLDWDDYDADDALEPLGAIFPVKKDEAGEETLEPFHRSIVEWVQDRNLSGREYRVSATKGYERFVEHLYPAFESWQQQREGNDSGWLFSFLAESLAFLEQWNPLKAVISDAHAPSIVDDVTLWTWWRSVCGDSASSMAGESYRGIKDSDQANYAADFLYFIGNYRMAATLHTYVFEMRRALLGDKHPDVATSLSNLGLVLYSQGRYEEAEFYHRKSLEMRRELLGDKHPDVATSMSDLAKTILEKHFKSSDDIEEAEMLQREALTMRCELLGDKHPNVAASLHHLADFLNSQGNHEEAEKLFREALVMRRKLLGNKHPDTTSSMDNLAGVFDSQDKHEEAEHLYRELLAVDRGLLRDKHPSVIGKSINNLAGVLNSQDKYEEAERLYRELLKMIREVLGDKHSYVAISLNNLASVLESRGKHEEAEQLLRECNSE